MSERVLGNYLRSHRRRSGLSQGDVGKLLGYKYHWQVARHERSKAVPPLLIALAYESIYQVPVATMFTGIYATVAHVVNRNLATFHKEMLAGSPRRRVLISHAKKLEWLKQRRKTSNA